MKKPATRKKPAARTRKKRAGPLDQLFSGVDIDALRRMLAAQARSVEDMLEPFLLAEMEEIEDGPSPEAMSELAEELERLRIDANGGDPAARETLQRVRAMIDEAAEEDGIHPAALMMLGRVFAGAGVDIGAAARAAMSRFFSRSMVHAPGDDVLSEIVQPLLDEFEGDDFDLHEEARRTTEVFPAEARARLAESLAGRPGRGSRAAVGFLLDPEETIAISRATRLRRSDWSAAWRRSGSKPSFPTSRRRPTSSSPFSPKTLPPRRRSRRRTGR